VRIPELQQQLTEGHGQFIRTIQNVADADFAKSVNNKWTAGQQIEHIIKSVAPVNMAFALPGFMLKMMFGKANRPSRTYDQLVEKYHAKLNQGGRAPGRFVPASVRVSQRAALIKKLEHVTQSLSKRIEDFSEEQLDLLLLPHPLLGKLTLREMIYFTIYHAGHHERQVIENLTLRD
jgi:DinB superfamily